MAYTIISQNNSTTTLSDGVNTITVPSRVNLTSGNFTIVEVNNNMATLEDGDGNVYRDIPCVATLAGEGGGGGAVSSVNGQTGAVVLSAEDVGATPQYSTMPTADSTNVGEIVQFTGATDATYTNGFFYKCVSESTEESYTGSVVDSTAELGTVTIDATSLTQWFQQTLAEAQNYPEDLPYFEGILNGTANGVFSYNNSTEWTFYDSTEGFKESPYSMSITQYPDLISFTGTATPGDIVEVAITPVGSTTYSWQQIDVQPAPEALPDQTGQSGKFLTTDGTDASWSDTIREHTVFYDPSVTVYPNNTVNLIQFKAVTQFTPSGEVLGGIKLSGAGPILWGSNSYNGVSFGSNVTPTSNNSYDLGKSAFGITNAWRKIYVNKISSGAQDISVPNVDGKMAIQVSTLPTAASTNEGEIYQFIGTTDSSYTNGHFYQCVSDGADPATYSWTAVQVQAGGGGSLPSQTGNAGKFLTTDGTDASWGNTVKEIEVKSQSSNFYKLKLSSDGTSISGLYYSEDNYDTAHFTYDSTHNRWVLKGAYSNYFVFDELNTCLRTQSTGGSLGSSSVMWNSIYVTKINNGADITVPTTGGTMVVATPPSADGTYVLKATVSSGVVTVAWVAE